MSNEEVKEEPIQENEPSRIEELEHLLSEYELNDVKKAQAIGKLIVYSAYEELKGSLDNGMINPELTANIIRDIYQTREVTRRELIKAKTYKGETTHDQSTKVPGTMKKNYTTPSPLRDMVTLIRSVNR